MSCSPLFFTKNEFRISRVYQPIRTSLVSLSVSYWFFRQNNLIGSKFVKIQNSIIVFHFSRNHVVNDSTDNKYDFHKKKKKEFSRVPISTSIVCSKIRNSIFVKICGEQYNRQQLRLTWITSSEPETTKQSSRMLSPLRNIKSPGAEWIMSKFTAKALQGKQSILIIMSTCHTILPSKLWTKTQFELFFHPNWADMYRLQNIWDFTEDS